MAKITNGTPVSAPLTPGFDDANTWPTHLAKYGKGGLEVVETIADRDAISDDRKEDKAVLVRSDTGGLPSLYEWSSGGWNKIDLGDFSGMSISDGINVFNDIAELKLIGLKVSQDPNDSIDVATITADNMTDWTTLGNPTYSGKANAMIVEPPLQVYPDPDKTDTNRLALEKGIFEPKHAPGYLAYVDFPEKLIGKLGFHTLGHYDSAIYPTDVVVDGGSFIVTDEKNKAIGIQEYDGDDPNVTGGADFLIAYRVAIKGKAVNAGKIKIYLAKKPFGDAGASIDYLKDVNGDLLAKEVSYKAGDTFGALEVLGIVNAEGLTEFTMHVEHSFSDSLVIEERATGLSGIMVQALENLAKTGQALTQYEVDTQQNIEFSRVYFGNSIMSFNWEATHSLPMEEIQAGVGANLPDGFHFKNLSGIYIGSKDNYIYIRDAGTVCDFSFGKIFSSFDSRVLHGKDITTKASINAQGSPFTVSLVKWTGAPDKYTSSIFSKRTDATVVFDDGWSLVDSMFFPESSTEAFQTSSIKFNVPNDANNFAVIVYPGVPNSPLELKIKNFDIDVDKPFYAYELYEAGKLHKVHLYESDKYARFIQDNQGYVSLRYTINNNVDGQPMPCGILKKGHADISVDPTVNEIVGSGASGGEGGLKFSKDGKVIINTTLWLHSEKPSGTTSSVKFWWVLINSNNVESKVIPSETTFEISGNSSGDYSMKELTLSVETGDRLALRASADAADGAFLQSNTPSHPMVDVEARFTELLSDTSDDPFSGVDLTQFDRVYESVLTATKVVSNASSVSVKMDIPEDMNISILNAVKQLPDSSIRPVDRLDWVYSNVTKTLTVSFGETVQIGMITIGVYL